MQPSNPLYEEFIETHPFFDSKMYLGYSSELRRQLNNILIGLALPCLRGRRRLLWGYIDHPTRPNIRIPAKGEGGDMKVLATALIMHASGDYLVDDILDWVNKTNPYARLERDTFYYVLRTRPCFPEALLPLEKRLKIIYDGYAGRRPSFATASLQGAEKKLNEERTASSRETEAEES